MRIWNVDFRIILLAILLSLYVNSAFSQWSGLSSGTDKTVSTFYVDSISDLLYIGGNFTSAGGMNINNIATWNGLNWSAFGSNEIFSSHGVIYAITKFNGEIVIGGKFDSIGNKKVDNISIWNGSAWENMGSGFNDLVSDLIVYNGELYACGQFAYSDTTLTGPVAKWNGMNWERVSLFIGYATSMTEYLGKLVIGGPFFHQSITSIFGIASWNGIDVDTILGAFNYSIIKLYSFDDTLYATGSFTGPPSNYVSIFYNQSWHSIGAPMGGSNWITDIIKFNDKLYLCGYFTNPPDLCSYNQVGFDSVADVAGYVSCLAVFNNELYAGGLYNQLNGQTMNNIARYLDPSNSINEYNKSKKIEMFPNPCQAGKTTINVLLPNQERECFLEVFSLDGKFIESKRIEIINTDRFDIDINLERGVYFLRFNFPSLNRYINKIIII